MQEKTEKQTQTDMQETTSAQTKKGTRKKQAESHAGLLGRKLSRTVILLTALAFVLFLFIAAWQTFKTSRGREVDSQHSQLQQAAGRISSLQRTIQNIASLIVYNDVVQKGISGRTLTQGDELFAARKISETLKEYQHIVDGTEEITIYTSDGRTLTSRYVRGAMNPETSAWFRDFLASGKNSGFTNVHASVPMQDGYTTDVFSYITGYYSIDDYRNKLGELIINVEYRTLLEMIQIDTTLLKGYVLLDSSLVPLVQSGEISPEETMIAGESSNGLYRSKNGGVYVVCDEMEDGWVLVSEISGTQLIRRALAATLPIFAVFVIMLAGLWFLMSLMIRRITGPVNTLSQAAARVGQGDFSVSVNIRTGDEIEDLGESFNRMVVDINRLMKASVEHEKKIQQMQTENLMLQINPHFIYNTMNSIVYMARMEGNDQIADFTNAFISLLQSTLRVRSSIFTTLEEEIRNVRNYLYLQEYRYGNKFTYEIDCPEELLPSQVISVMLQPVVENAIFHGIAPKEGPGKITVTVYSVTHTSEAGTEKASDQVSGQPSEQKDLEIRIADDGVGIDPQTLSELLKEDYVQKGGIHKIGIGNVHARIREVYGNDYGLTIVSSPGEGTTVTARIPWVAVISR